MEIDARLANRIADTVKSDLLGGSVKVYDEAGNLLTNAKFSGFKPTSNGIVAALPLTPSRAESDGIPAKFEAFNSTGERALVGSAGHKDDMPRPEMTFKTKQVIKDADVMVESFIFSVAGVSK